MADHQLAMSVDIQAGRDFMDQNLGHSANLLGQCGQD